MNIRDLFNNLDRSDIEKWCRSQTQVAYLGDHRALCRVLGKYLMYVDTRDLSLAPHMMLNGFWEMWVTQAIVDYVKPGMRCIDVGANVGYYTLLLSDLVGDQGRVSAFEPLEELHHLLHDAISVNGFGAIAHVNGIALGATSGETELAFAPHLLGSSAIGGFDGATSSRRVRETTIDRTHHGAIDFVKIDVQGYELEVLNGMLGTIAQSPKIAIAMEFTPGEHMDPQGSIEKIEAMGLRVQAIGTDGQVRPISLEDATKADTGDHRMLWLTRAP